MNPRVQTRSETAADARAISDVTVAAFRTLEISGHTEQFIVEPLRAAGARAVSLVGVSHESFFALSFDGRCPQGSVVFPEGFTATGRPGEVRRDGSARPFRRTPP